jgi:hypothetical protein
MILILGSSRRAASQSVETSGSSADVIFISDRSVRFVPSAFKGLASPGHLRMMEQIDVT